MLAEDWRIEYSTVRPHSALDYLNPTDYAKAWPAPAKLVAWQSRPAVSR